MPSVGKVHYSAAVVEGKLRMREPSTPVCLPALSFSL
jgi:hypothetical protein